VLLADAPIGPPTFRAFSHLLGKCGTTFFGNLELARRCRRGFPRSLHDVPCLLPGPDSMLRRGLDEWFYAKKIRPAIVGEFDDNALMNIFGQDGRGVFPGPTAIEADLQRLYQVHVIGESGPSPSASTPSPSSEGSSIQRSSRSVRARGSACLHDERRRRHASARPAKA
jgi:LysR family transcriptional activator of nhaA